MPKRTDAPASAPQEKVVKEAKPKKVATPKKEAAPEVDAPVTEQPETTVRKSPLQENFKKFLKDAGIDPETIAEIQEREVKGEDGVKMPTVFATFSPEGPKDEQVDEPFNIAIIKSALFFYHTAPETIATGKGAYLEVLPPASAEDSYILCYHEE